MGQIKLIGTFFLIAVFSVAIISYVSNFGDDNNAVVKLSDDGDFSSLDTNIKSDLQTQTVSLNSSAGAISNSELDPGDETLRKVGIFSSITGPLSAVKSVLSMGQKKIFGSDTGFGYVFGSLSAFLIILTVLYGWKTLKSGSVD